MCVRYFSVRFPLILRSFFDSRTERERSANGGSTEDERRTNGERTENERRTNGERTENERRTMRKIYRRIYWLQNPAQKKLQILNTREASVNEKINKKINGIIDDY